MNFVKKLYLDGITPDDEVVIKTLNKLKIPVFILIRPRAGDFVYNNEEFKLMKSDIIKFKKTRLQWNCLWGIKY